MPSIRMLDEGRHSEGEARLGDVGFEDPSPRTLVSEETGLSEADVGVALVNVARELLRGSGSALSKWVVDRRGSNSKNVQTNTAPSLGWTRHILEGRRVVSSDCPQAEEVVWGGRGCGCWRRSPRRVV